jgi:urease accessory protein
MLTEAIASVGRVGHLRLQYGRQDRRTILTASHCNSPWHLLPTIDLDDTGAAYTLLLNPSGGLVGGDRLHLQARLDPDTHVVFSTPSANRIYRSASAKAVQTVELHVGGGARLEWVPDVTIPFQDSRYRQVISMTLDPAATVLCWDALAAGRLACGERWAFSSLENEIKIVGCHGRPMLDRYRLYGGSDGVGLVSEWDYVGSFYMVGDSVPNPVWNDLDQWIGEILDSWRNRVLAGMTEPSSGGRVVKILARGSTEFQAAFETVWRLARERLCGLPAANLRRY